MSAASSCIAQLRAEDGRDLRYEVSTKEQAAALLYRAATQHGVIQGGTISVLYEQWPGLRVTIKKYGGAPLLGDSTGLCEGALWS